MRLDKYLKNSRIIKRRTVAKEACEQGRVEVNGRVAKPGLELKTGDEICVTFGSNVLKVRVLSMPENVRKIEFAKGFGDLSENAEYQYAKDEQRVLMQKQTVMQAELESVKPGDFSDATTDEVMPGVTVVFEGAEGRKTYTVLGEWDNDVDKGILASKTRLAQNMLGKKVGDQFELPGAEGEVKFARIVEILPLSDEVREWMKLPPGVQI